jgi:hypothetical protein
MRRTLLASCFLVIVGIVHGLPTGALADDCGGAVACDCGDVVVVDRTLVPGVDPVLAVPCPGIALFVDLGVTLNLGGGTIRSVCPGCGGGIRVQSGATVEAGTITGFGIGIEGNGVHNLAFGVLVHGVRLVGNSVGISLAGAGNTIEQCLVTGSTSAGIMLVESVLEGDPGGNRVRGCRVEDNVGDGIVLLEESGDVVNAVIESNLVRRNAGNGIDVQAGSTVVSLNRVEDNDQGIVVSGTSPELATTSITRNVVLRNRTDGVVIDGVGLLVDRNQSKFNAGEGFNIAGTGHTVTLNIALDNGDDGFTVSATDSTLARNTASYNDGVGIRDTTAGNGTAGTANTYTANRCTGNGLGNSSPPGLCF